jgi:hypothetical protein
MAILAAACSADEPTRRGGDAKSSAGSDSADGGSRAPAANGGGGGGGEAGRSSGAAGLMSVPSGGTGGMSGGNAGDASSMPPDFSCVKQTEEAKRVPVEMYIMLDRSESMLGVTGTGETKWDAVKKALTLFVSDPRSEGLYVGLQYFPIGKPGVPTECVEDSECGAAGPCMTRLCEPPPTQAMFVPVYCASDADCSADTLGCTEFGLCERDQSVVCFEFGFNACGRLGNCLHVRSECKGYSSCSADDYATPAVQIGQLPGQAGAIIASLGGAQQVGLTPTSAALSGALKQAAARAKAEPTHRVIALLATDGLPTECEPIDPTAVAGIAMDAAAQTPALNTYVIGVFSPEETPALMNLDSWAKAGGTEKAFILDPNQDVNAQFLDALEKIRGGTLSCEYVLPPSPQGNEIDLGLVNVDVVSDKMTQQLRYVGDAASCNKTQFGWHYDADPASGKATKIVTCSSTCDMLKMTSGKVEVRIGCKTMGPD